MKLNEIESFDSETDFIDFERAIENPTKEGELKSVERGYSSSNGCWISVYEDRRGDRWTFAHPDQAFRGWFRRTAGQE